LIYLATPYSHPDAEVREHRFREVNRVAADLMRDGLHVFSPISHTHPIAVAGDLPKDWEFWQAYDRTVLSACSKVMVLMQDGWRESTGVQAEIEIAREMGLPVEFIEPYTRAHAPDCGIAVNGRHDCSCGANAPQRAPRPTFVVCVECGQMMLKGTEPEPYNGEVICEPCLEDLAEFEDEAADEAADEEDEE
jgi:hypothetical protein